MIEFKLENGFKINLETSEKVFTPTGTTEVVIEAVLENNKEKKNILIVDIPFLPRPLELIFMPFFNPIRFIFVLKLFCFQKVS